MVHSCDALLAGGAVMAHWYLYLITLFAHSLEDRFDMHYLLHSKVVIVLYGWNDLVFTSFPIFISRFLDMIWNILQFGIVKPFYLLKNCLILVQIKLQSIKPYLSIITYYLSFFSLVLVFNTWFQYTINASLHSWTYVSLLHSLFASLQSFLWFIIAIIFTAWGVFSTCTKLS